MDFNLKNISEANQLIKVLFESNSHPAYLIDKRKKIRYANQAFLDFIDKYLDQIILQDFCKTMGCIFCSNYNEPPHLQCKICRIDELISEPVEKEISLVREFIFANKPELKYLKYHSYPIHSNDELLFLVIIHDLTTEALSKISFEY